MVATKLRILVFLQLLHYLTFTQSNFITLLTEFKVTCNPSVHPCKSWVTYTKKNDLSTYLINVEAEVIKPGLNFQSVNFKIFKNPIGRRNESTKLMDVNTDVCKFFKRKNRGDPFAIYFIGLMKKYGKIAGCPMLPGHYYVYNLTTNDFGIPDFAGYLLGKSDMTMKFNLGAKLKQRFVSTMNITFIGGYRNDK